MTLTRCNLGTVRDRHIKPYIFVNVMKRRIQNRVGGNLKIQISNGQKFKFLTVKLYFSTNTDLRPSDQFIKVPKGSGPHFKSFLSYRWSIIWCGAPNPAVIINKKKVVVVWRSTERKMRPSDRPSDHPTIRSTIRPLLAQPMKSRFSFDRQMMSLESLWGHIFID